MSRALVGNPVRRQSRRVSAIDVALCTDSIGQQNDLAGRVFQPSLARAIEVYQDRAGWPGDVPTIRFVGSLDSSSMSSRGRMAHDIVSGQTVQAVRADLATRMNALARAPAFYLFLLGANDLFDGRTQAQVLDDLNDCCAQVRAKWPGVTVPGVITPKDNRIDFASTTANRAARAAILAGGVPQAGVLVDTGSIAQTALAADGVHLAGPESPTVLASWAGPLPRATCGPMALAYEVLSQALRPGLMPPLLAGE
jgi:hypothetical protein